MGLNIDITVLSGVSAGDVFHFHVEENSSLSVGRATESDIVLHDPTVSRKHVRIERRPSGVFIVDEGSTHGTFHMGFHVEPGSESARQLHSDDEFKIGDLLFRVNFDESEFAPKEKRTEKKNERPAAVATGARSWLRGKKGALVAVVLVVAVCALLFGGGEKGGLPAQRGNDIIQVPNFSVAGYVLGDAGDRKEDRDRSHLDKAQYDIPASDVLIEYSIMNESKVNVLLDDIVVEQLEPSPASWQLRQMLIRGVALGKQRRIVFDNLDFPRKPEQQGKLKQWGVRDVRATPLTATGGIEAGFDPHLKSAIGMVEGIDKSASGLYLLVRGLQSSALELMKELKIDETGYRVDPGAEETTKISDVSELESRLELIRSGRERDNGVSASTAYLRDVTKIVSQLDAEMWRRVNNRLSQAKVASQVKNYIEAHDQLVSTMAMFPNQEDYRWALVNRMFMDNKIIPKRVRQNPGNYRK